MLAEFLTSALVTLLVTVDPPGLAPLFLGVTRGMSDRERRQVGLRASIIAAAIMAVGGVAEIVLGVDAEGESLEDIAAPITAEDSGPAKE